MSEPPKNSGSPVASWARSTSAVGQHQQQAVAADDGGAPVRRPRVTTSTPPAQQQTPHGGTSSGSTSSGVSRHIDTSYVLPSHRGTAGGAVGHAPATHAGHNSDGTVTFRPTASNPQFSIQSPLKRPTSQMLPLPRGGSDATPTAAPPAQRSASTSSYTTGGGGGAHPDHNQQQQQQQSLFDVPLERAGGGGRTSSLSLPRPSMSSTAATPPPPPLSTDNRHHQPTAATAVPPRSASSSHGGYALPNYPTTHSSSSGGGGHPNPEPLAAGGGGGGLSSSGTSSAPKPIENAAFLSDVLFMWMGVERTKYLRFSPAASQYELSSSAEGSVRQRKAIEQLQECGLLALEIEGMLRRPDVGRGGGGGGDMSFLQQSLRAAIRNQMTQYHYFVSALRERVSELTVADLVVAHKKAVPKLSTMSLILTETRTAKGGELVSRMQSLVQQGSRRLSSFVREIHMETVTPLVAMAAEWIVVGEVADPFHEFFVKVNHNVDIASDLFWTSRFALEPMMLPTSVPLEVAENILRVGRNIAFVSKCCRAKQWQVDPAIASAAHGITFSSLPVVVRDALQCTNRAVMQLVREKLRLKEVLGVIQNYLLVGYGDFFEMLIRRLDPVMNKPSPTIQASVVADHVQVALLEATTMQHSSNKRTDDSDIVLQLESEMIKAEGYTGWESFSLTLPLPTPLNNMFDAEAKRVYRRLFKMLFSVKRAEVSLKQSWRQSVVLDRLLVRMTMRRGGQGGRVGASTTPTVAEVVAPPDEAEMAVWRKVAADAHLLGLQFNHFVSNLWSYFVSEVSTTAWEKLTRAVAACTSFDELREVHSIYVQHLTLYALLHTDCKDVREHVLAILSLTRTLCAAQVQLTNLLERGVGNIINISARYQQIADDFQLHVTSLLRLLEEGHMQFDYLNFLLLRLNFNQYYRDTGASAGNTEF